MNIQRFDPSRFTTNQSKPLPIMLLLDVSGSMNEVISGTFERTGEKLVEDGKTWEIVQGGMSRIQILNQAVQEMLASFAQEEQLHHEFLVSIITFGATVQVHLAPTKASRVAWAPLQAAGETPLGEALAMAKRLIEDKEATPSRAYRPVVVLVSDGKPTDRWTESLESFVSAGRSTKCDRIALAIGAGADENMLKKFIAGTPNPLFRAENAKQILEAFRRVTMSVTVRCQSKDPNQVPGLGGATAAPAALPAKAPGATNKASGKSTGSPDTGAGAGSSDDDGYW